MKNLEKFRIRARAVILHEGKLLVVRHTPRSPYAALPGGHLEWGESIEQCLSREIEEELGITPQIGRLLYVHNLILDGVQFIEFFFEVTNSSAFFVERNLKATHAHEIDEIFWTLPEDSQNIRPQKIADDFKSGQILANSTRLIEYPGQDTQS